MLNARIPLRIEIKKLKLFTPFSCFQQNSRPAGSAFDQMRYRDFPAALKNIFECFVQNK